MKLYTFPTRYVDHWSPWTRWFAWCPVTIGDEIRWMETVERRHQDTHAVGWGHTWIRWYEYRLTQQKTEGSRISRAASCVMTLVPSLQVLQEEVEALRASLPDAYQQSAVRLQARLDTLFDDLLDVADAVDMDPDFS